MPHDDRGCTPTGLSLRAGAPHDAHSPFALSGWPSWPMIIITKRCCDGPQGDVRWSHIQVRLQKSTRAQAARATSCRVQNTMPSISCSRHSASGLGSEEECKLPDSVPCSRTRQSAVAAACLSAKLPSHCTSTPLKMQLMTAHHHADEQRQQAQDQGRAKWQLAAAFLRKSTQQHAPTIA